MARALFCQSRSSAIMASFTRKCVKSCLFTFLTFLFVVILACNESMHISVESPSGCLKMGFFSKLFFWKAKEKQTNAASENAKSLLENKENDTSKDLSIESSEIVSQGNDDILLSKDLYTPIQHVLNGFYDGLLEKGKRLLKANRYSEAATIYDELFIAITQGCYPKAAQKDSIIIKTVRYRLVESHFLMGNYPKALEFCTQNKDPKTDPDMLYLSALCYREMQEYEKALTFFFTYINLHDIDGSTLAYLDYALFEIGHYYFSRGQRVKARCFFERLLQFDRQPSHLAALYLARLDLDEKHVREADILLSNTLNKLNENDPHFYECLYLRGMAAFASKDLAKAREFFGQSLSFPANIWRTSEKMTCDYTNVPWRDNALYHLGWTNLYLADDFEKTEQEVCYFFNCGVECFSQAKTEASLLSLAQLYKIQYQRFHEAQILKKIEGICGKDNFAFSLEGELQALLIQAEAVEDNSMKERLYRLATEEKYTNAPSYYDAWYFRGIHEFHRGLQSKRHDPIFFDHAATAFAKAFQGMEKNDKQKAASALKLGAKANMFRHSPLTSLAMLENLLCKFEESEEEREETLYLRGILASQMTDLSYFPVAEDSFNFIIVNFPNGKYRSDAFYALGTLYYESAHYEKAKQTFIQLATERVAYDRASDAWFWAAESAACLGENASTLRRHLYENYPKTRNAAEAYFREFSYSDYVAGTCEALVHLKKFVGLFPESPLQIIVHYLIGIHDVRLAKYAFEKSLNHYAFFSEKEVLDEPYIYFHHQATLELAELYLQSEELENLDACEKLLTSLTCECSQTNQTFHKKTLLDSSQLEEGQFKLARCYLKKGQDAHAQVLLEHLLANYMVAHKQEGSLLSKVWQELGKLALKCGECEKALECLAHAQESGSPFFSDDERLSLWLLQSAVYREKKQYDIAMRYLSKAINAETASPLRIKAMYLRSEIYELEGRPELAMRQLDFIAKKRGKKP